MLFQGLNVHVYTCVPVSVPLINRRFFFWLHRISATRFLVKSPWDTADPASCILHQKAEGVVFASKSMSGRDRPNRTKEHSDPWWILCLLIPIRLFFFGKLVHCTSNTMSLYIYRERDLLTSGIRSEQSSKSELWLFAERAMTN